MIKVYAFTGTSARNEIGPGRRKKARMHTGAMPGLQHLSRMPGAPVSADRTDRAAMPAVTLVKRVGFDYSPG